MLRRILVPYLSHSAVSPDVPHFDHRAAGFRGPDRAGAHHAHGVGAASPGHRDRLSCGPSTPPPRRRRAPLRLQPGAQEPRRPGARKRNPGHPKPGTAHHQPDDARSRRARTTSSATRSITPSARPSNCCPRASSPANRPPGGAPCRSTAASRTAWTATCPWSPTRASSARRRPSARTRAYVLLIADENCKVAAYIEGTREQGILSGERVAAGRQPDLNAELPVQDGADQTRPAGVEQRGDRRGVPDQRAAGHHPRVPAARARRPARRSPRRWIFSKLENVFVVLGKRGARTGNDAGVFRHRAAGRFSRRRFPILAGRRCRRSSARGCWFSRSSWPTGRWRCPSRRCWRSGFSTACSTTRSTCSS